MYNFIEKKVKLPKHDCDVTLEWPNGQKVVVQVRPSNSAVNYGGSLDIILPYDMVVTNWKGDDMEPAQAYKKEKPEARVAKQLVLSMDEDWYREEN